MADCEIATFGPTFTIRNWNGVTADGLTAVGYNGSSGTFYKIDTATWTSESTFHSTANFIGGFAVDSSDVLYYIDTTDFVTMSLRRVNLDGTGFTTVATGFPVVFAGMSYDPVGDRFWLHDGSSLIRTLTKTGTITTRATLSSPVWQPLIASDGAAWVQYFGSPTLARIDGSTYAVQTTNAVTAGNQHWVDCATGGIVAIDFPNVRHFQPGITSTIVACDFTGIPATHSFWTPDYTRVWISEASSDRWQIWEIECVVGGFPPLAIYARGDDKATGGPVIPPFWRTRQKSGRILQGAGHA
jgi:hypothetical protein